LPTEVTLYVAVSDAVADADTGVVLALVDALETDLREEGYQVTVLAARPDERPPRPRLEVQVVASDGGDETLRGAGQFGGLFGLTGSAVGIAAMVSGASDIEVEYYVVSANGGKPTVQGQLSAGSIGDDAADAGKSAGHAIARRLIGGAKRPRYGD
jgi:hypothetical protein